MSNIHAVCIIKTKQVCSILITSVDMRVSVCVCVCVCVCVLLHVHVHVAYTCIAFHET